MFSSLVERALSRVKKIRKPTPLHSHHEDVELVRRVRGKKLPRFSQFFHIRAILSRGELRVLQGSAVVFFGAALWLLFFMLGQYRIQVPHPGGRYVEAVIGSPELANPLFASVNDVDMDIVRLVYSGLMRYDEKQRLVPDLAATYTVSPDKKVYIFELRKDVRWHDGEPFQARDVVFTIQAAQNPIVASPLLVSFQGVEARVIDDFTVQLTLKEPFAPFLGALTLGIIPEHIWGDVPAERIRLHKNNLQPIGTGPFQFSKLLKDDTGYIYQYELVRNPAYYRQSTYLDSFVLQFFSEFEGPTGAIQAVREQRAHGLSFVPHDLKDNVERKHIVIHTLHLPQYTALFLNQGHDEALRFKEARTALEMAIDKDRLLKEVLNGEGEVVWGPILPGYLGYATDTPRTQYALEEANVMLDTISTRISADEYRSIRKNDLLKTLGTSASSTTEISTSTQAIEAQVDALLAEELHDAQVFYRRLKDGRLLELSLVTADTPEYRQVAELIAGFWQDIGIKTVIGLIPTKEFNRDVLKDRTYDVLLYGFIIGGDPDQYPFWHSSQIDFPGLNLARYANRTVDALLVKAREEGDTGEAEEAYKKFQVTLLQDRPAIFLYAPTYSYATSDRIFGISGDRIFHPADRLNGVASWYMKTAGQWQKK